jgi:hypothetical protein
MDLSENLRIALIVACSALGGSLIGGLISLRAARLAADREDRRIRENLERQTAHERITKLYDPLLNYLSPGPPYEEFCLDREICARVIEAIEKNKKFASPELLKIFYEFRHAFRNDFKSIQSGLDSSIYNLVCCEHEKLKDIIGFGRILKNPSKTKVVSDKMSSIFGKSKSFLSGRIGKIRKKPGLKEERK